MTVIDQHTRTEASRSQHLNVMVTGVASDSHTWNLIYLQLALEECGHRVTNLGPCVTADMLVRQCREDRPDVVVMSSVNGHGSHDGAEAVRDLRDLVDLADLHVVIGGKLGIDGADSAHDQLLAAGFDAVFGDDEVPDFLAHLKSLAHARVR